MAFDVAGDIYGIDLEMFDEQVLAAYVVDGPEPVLVETGYARGVETLRTGLRDVGIPPEELDHAVVSHIHLDHSGGAAALVEDAPDLRVYVHESTAEFLISPDALIESTKRAMGRHFEEFGSPEPIPEDNLVRVGDEGASLSAGDRALDLVYTPGHAPDHLAVWDPTSGTLFANEAIGSYYPRAGVWLPPATLPRFDVAAVGETIDRLRGFDAERLALSHFGSRDDPHAEIDTAAERLTLFDERIPELYTEHDRDLMETERAVRSELVDLDPYHDDIESFEARFQTRGFLRYHGLIE
ncbi:MBL fold metallo-hydrolase [Halomarina halobia]|uniref:MBL fold metallo-hydrolase n=1 Tax=Halomarina halobia TaxID=3033386 RepID=A0ABD6AE73_9EURY|nr:MBL fold metallo-hydrolase [Halomarina sp. PSR21]